MQEVKELMKDRYEVMQPYPFSCLPIGYIVTEEVPLVHYQALNKLVSALDYLLEFPKIFRPMKWYEKRTVDTLASIRWFKIIATPSYWIVGDIVPVTDIEYKENTHPPEVKRYIGKYNHTFKLEDVEPATEAQYLQFKKENKIS